jgi:nitrate reductase gamma subunit
MKSSRQSRTRGAIVLLFAVLAASRAIKYSRGTPAFLLGATAGILLVLGVVLLLKRNSSGKKRG